MALLDLILPFAAVLLIGVWQLWALRRDEKRRDDTAAPTKADDDDEHES